MGQNNKKKGGVVVNIASISGLDPFECIPIYGGIKHGVVGLTKAFGVGRLCFVSSYNFAKRSGVKRVGLHYTAVHISGPSPKMMDDLELLNPHISKFAGLSISLEICLLSDGYRSLPQFLGEMGDRNLKQSNTASFYIVYNYVTVLFHLDIFQDV
jgi:hypothetical protein